MAETATESEVQTTDITFKTIAQDVFKMTFPLSTTIAEVKSKIFADKGEEFEIERQKLIYNGKILNDTQTLGEINVDEKKYIVVMVSKKRVEQPAVAQSSSTATVEPMKQTTPAPEPTPTVSAVAPTPAASNTAVTAEQEETIAVVSAMGYPREEVIRALRAAFWNADRAVEYLCSGIPESATEGEANPAGALVEEPALGEDENPLDFLRLSPQFAQLCQLVRSQPEMLPQVLSQIDTSNPDLMAIIRSNQEAFLQMLNESVEGGEQLGEGAGGEEVGQPGHVAGHLTIAVTEADRNALQRLQAMGFPEQLVIEAYFSCDKNEDLAVNYILARMEEASNEED